MFGSRRLLSAVLAGVVIACPAQFVHGQGDQWQISQGHAEMLRRHDAPALPERWDAESVGEWAGFLKSLAKEGVSRERIQRIHQIIARSLISDSGWMLDGKRRLACLQLANWLALPRSVPERSLIREHVADGVVKQLSAEAQAQLRKRMLEHDYALPMAVMTLVNAARRGEPGELASLDAYFEEKADSSEGDTKAGWLMARAYAAEASTQPTWSVLHGQSYLNEALLVSTTNDRKREIVKWLVQGQAALGNPDRARGILADHADLYRSGEHYAQSENLQMQINAAARAQSTWVQKQVDFETDQRQQLLLKRLAAARASGNAAQAERYERLLKQFEN